MLTEPELMTARSWVGRKKRRARRRVMPKHITFNQLKAVMAVRVGQPGMPAQASLDNANSALRKFCRAITTDMDARVGNTLRDDFDESLKLYREQLERAGNQRKSINNEASLMSVWARLIRTLDHEGATEEGTITPFQARLNELFDTRADMFRIAKRAAVSWRTLRNWKNGAMPKSESDGALRRLATACGLAPDSLIKLLPFAVGRRLECSVPVVEILSRKRNGKLCRSPYLLKPHQIKGVNESFKDEWRGFLMHKVRLGKATADGAPSAKPSIRDRIRAAKEHKPDERDRVWRTRPADDYTTDSLPPWVNTIGGLVAPSANKNFKDVTAYLGWLRLEPAEGGCGVPIEQLSMGMLVDEERLDAFLEWHAERVGSVNAGTIGFIANIRSYMRAETGYLWLSTEIGRRMGFDEAAWRARCEKLNDAMGLWLCQYSSIREPARDPALPLKPLLDLPRPLQGFRDAINRYSKEVRRSAHQRASQARDLALLAVSISNPLRLTNIRLLTYKSDNTGHFRTTKMGSGWEIFVPKEEFKNIHGAAKYRDYRMPLSEIAAYYLEAYLTKWWGYLGGPGTRNFVFIPKGKPDKVWDNLDTQYANVTKRILAPLGCPSIRTHGVRYLVGTSIIMATQGNVDLAAAALHDTNKTVEKHYKKLLDSFSARGIHAVIGRDLALDEDAVGLVAIPDAAHFTKPLPGAAAV